jgi:predicted RNA-binding Zn-ribbon protein involved in translation (DUF1610 family)
VESEQPQEEKIDIPCPKCGQKELFLTKTKRSFAWKCKNKDCSFDTNKLSDVFSHPKKELIVAQKLKELCPHLLFVENTPIDSDLISGKLGNQEVRYDFSVFWFADKIDKIKVSIVQNIDHKRYLETDEMYLQGQEKVFEYLSKIDSLLIFYLPNEPVTEKQLGIASCKELKKFATEVKDRFGNNQYSIPKEIRPALISFDREKIVSMLHRNLWKVIKERRYMF